MTISTDIEKNTLTEFTIFHVKKKKTLNKDRQSFSSNSWNKTRKSILTSSIQYYTGSSSLFYLARKGKRLEEAPTLDKKRKDYSSHLSISWI